MTSGSLRPAATVLVLRDCPGGVEVFMVQRDAAIRFMGGAHVFPGGALDAHDADAALERWMDGRAHAVGQLAPLADSDALAFHVAAIRELFEEAGVLLARRADSRLVSFADDKALASRLDQDRIDLHAGRITVQDLLVREQMRLALDTLITFAHWVTPVVEDRRYDTRFFLARMPEGQSAQHDTHESTASTWMTPRQALEAATQGDIALPPPTWVSLRELEPFSSVDEALAWARTLTITCRLPDAVEDARGRRLIMPDHSEFILSGGTWQPA